MPFWLRMMGRLGGTDFTYSFRAADPASRS